MWKVWKSYFCLKNCMGLEWKWNLWIFSPVQQSSISHFKFDYSWFEQEAEEAGRGGKVLVILKPWNKHLNIYAINILNINIIFNNWCMSRVCRQMDSFLSVSVANGRAGRSDVWQRLTRKPGFLCEVQIKGSAFYWLYSPRVMGVRRCSASWHSSFLL